MSGVASIQAWLEDVLGTNVPSWEVTPANLELLTRLKDSHLEAEADSELVLEDLEATKAEYEAEAERINAVCRQAGVTDEVMQGPAQAYSDVLVDICDKLEVDDCNTVGLHHKVSSLIVKQATSVPSAHRAQLEVDNLKQDTLDLYEVVGKLQAALNIAQKDSMKERANAGNTKKKHEMLYGKGKEYEKTVDKYDMLLVKNGVKDELKHGAIVELQLHLDQLLEEIRPLKAQLEGYGSLPPCTELAQVKIQEAAKLLEELTSQVTMKISALHV